MIGDSRIATQLAPVGSLTQTFLSADARFATDPKNSSQHPKQSGEIVDKFYKSNTYPRQFERLVGVDTMVELDTHTVIAVRYTD